MLQQLRTDVAQLAIAATGDGSARQQAAVILHSDAFRIMAMQRLREAARALHVPLANHLVRVAQMAMYAIEINTDVTLGEGVYFVHSLGIIIGGDARIGNRVRFYGNNTVGTVHDDGYPVIEDDVWVGAGARILGPIRIGARARIGANAVVLHDVPPDHVAAGVPATVRPRKDVPALAGER
jgi:serine O-acetyltransferase